jgi:hypothetical protein
MLSMQKGKGVALHDRMSYGIRLCLRQTPLDAGLRVGECHWHSRSNPDRTNKLKEPTKCRFF